MPINSSEEFDRAIARAAAANRPDAVEELTRLKSERFPESAGRPQPTGDVEQQSGPQPPMTWKETADDWANAIGSNVTQAFTTDILGAGGDVRELAAAGTGKIFGPTGAEVMRSGLSVIPGFGGPTSQELVEYMPEGFAYEAKTTPGKYLGTTARMAANIASPGGALRKGAMMVVPGLLSEAAGQATEGTDWEPWARLAGALTGGVGAGAFPAWRSVDQRAISKLLQELQASGMTPQQAAQRLQELGPESMLADVNPGMQVFNAATGISDPGATSTITPRLSGRRTGGGPQNSPGGQARTKSDLDAAFGAYVDPWAAREDNIASRAAVSPAYTAATANAPQLPRSLDELIAQGTTPHMRQAANTLGGMSQPSRRTMGTYFEQIDDALGADTPSMTVSRLHDIRMRLDAQLQGDNYGRPSADLADRGALQHVRNIVDDILKDRVPGWRQADAQFAPIQARRDAFDEGRTEVLAQGPSTWTEAQFLHHQGRSTPNVNQSRNQGMRAELERKASNERLNAGQQVDKVLSRDFNRPIIEHAIGQRRAEQLARGLDREDTFVETSNLGEVNRNSKTSTLREAAQRAWGQGGGGVVGDVITAAGVPTVLGHPGVGAAAGASVAANRLIQASVGRLSRPAAAVIRRVADDLTSIGPRRDALVQALIDESARQPLGMQTRERTEALVRVLLSTGVGAAAADQ